MSTCLMMFVKYPEEGRVKTRLAADVGDAKALEYYRCFVETLYQRLSPLSLDMNVCYTPQGHQNFFETWLPAKHCDVQKGETLGERLAYHFELAYGRGYQKVLVVGSDSPDMPLEYVEQAVHALDTKDAVLGPTEDGGYYLLGFTRSGYCKDSFLHDDWSTASTYATTLGILNKNDVSLAVLPEWYDIDEIGDWERFRYLHFPS